jgi:hypothetical protein
LIQNAKCEVGIATASHTFAALLVDEDFVLMTATNKTPVAQWADRAAKIAAKRNVAPIVACKTWGHREACGGGRGSVAAHFSA